MPALSKVEVLTPEEFLQWWRKAWRQGEHVAIAALTGSGKSTLGAFLCSVRKWVMALDAKGMDSTLSSTGWPRVGRWPLPRQMRDSIKDNEPCRVIIGRKCNSDEEFERNAELMRQALKGAWAQGAWSVWADEGQLLADKRYGNAGDRLEKMLIAARDRAISLVFTVQRVAIGRSTPSATAAYTQSTWLFVARTRDTKVADRLAEIAGRPAAEMRGLISSLPKYWWACLGLDPNEPIRLVKPPKLGNKSTKERAQQQSALTQFLWGRTA